MSVIVVTGAAGFLGRRVVEQLVARGDQVIAIARRPRPADVPASVQWVVADVANPAGYEASLKGADAALHVAGVTGKASRRVLEQGNVEATGAFVGASERAGVKRLVFVSSIAVSFTDQRHYTYAATKAAAEGVVRASSIPYAIVRPTIILGRGSAIEASLGKLAGLPVAPMFGDGKRLVQPVDVDDVAAFLVALAHDDVAGATIEFGGPAAYTMNELFARLRAARGVAGAPKFLHLPLKPLRELLALMEPLLLPVMPLTAGMLASFANDGAAAPNPIVDRLRPTRAESPARRAA